jgi:hypothetical protein
MQTLGCAPLARWGRRPVRTERKKSIGAALTATITHIAMVEALDDESADWMGKITGEHHQA